MTYFLKYLSFLIILADPNSNAQGCGLAHSDKLKEQYKMKRKQVYYDYEENLMALLKDIIDNTDRKILNSSLRLQKYHPEQDSMKLVFFSLHAS